MSRRDFNAEDRRPRRFPIGAEVQGATTDFRLWAPAASTVSLLIEEGGALLDVPLLPDGAGYFRAATSAPAGTRYRFRLDEAAYPDPASRFQPEGPHGPSEVVDPTTFKWTDQAWTGVSPDGLVIYEMHVGTFTPEGTWQAAVAHLPALRDLGVSVVEMMPVADFPGRFGWGYDGVDFFAPTRLYGSPDDLRAFIDCAHALGIGIVLDVVYNHAGPDGCWLDRFAPRYFSDTPTEWGRAFNFDGPDSGPVRAFFEANAAYWIDEFHFDGLRLDATQQIFDRSTPHILQTVTAAARLAAGSRSVWVVGENEPQDARLIRPVAEGGYGLDALWNDDYHHAAVVSATGKREAYYTDYVGTPQEFISCARHGFLYQGQWYSWQKQPRGTSTAGLLPRAFVGFLENHDQVANSLDGTRLHVRTPAPRHRALTALTLLGPWTPMLFQGQEFSSSAPFLYFADHASPLCQAVAAGRQEFLRQFPTIVEALRSQKLDAPHDEATFRKSQLDPGERTRHASAWRLHHSLLSLRRLDPAFAGAGRRGVDGATLGPEALVLRYRSSPAGDRLLVVNLGAPLALDVVNEPLLAPPGDRWTILWSSEDVDFGGAGTNGFACGGPWHVPATSAWVLG
jgi:maltooligosyltrehalose trehalohydrolase